MEQPELDPMRGAPADGIRDLGVPVLGQPVPGWPCLKELCLQGFHRMVTVPEPLLRWAFHSSAGISNHCHSSSATAWMWLCCGERKGFGMVWVGRDLEDDFMMILWWFYFQPSWHGRVWRACCSLILKFGLAINTVLVFREDCSVPQIWLSPYFLSLMGFIHFCCWLSPCYRMGGLFCTWDVQFPRVLWPIVFASHYISTFFSSAPEFLCFGELLCQAIIWYFYMCKAEHAGNTFLFWSCHCGSDFADGASAAWKHLTASWFCFLITFLSWRSAIVSELALTLLSTPCSKEFLFLADWNLLSLIMFPLPEQESSDRSPWTKPWCSAQPWTPHKSFRCTWQDKCG